MDDEHRADYIYRLAAKMDRERVERAKNCAGIKVAILATINGSQYEFAAVLGGEEKTDDVLVRELGRALLQRIRFQDEICASNQSLVEICARRKHPA